MPCRCYGHFSPSVFGGRDQNIAGCGISDSHVMFGVLLGHIQLIAQLLFDYFREKRNFISFGQVCTLVESIDVIFLTEDCQHLTRGI